MKKVIVICCTWLMCYSVVCAQHYQTVYADRIAYFSNASGNIQCVRIDSVAGQGLMPFKQIRPIDWNCFTPFGPSWIGEAIFIAESDNYFTNNDGKSIRIRTDAALNESWTAYDLPDSTKIVATVIDTGIISSYLGLSDSIKEIGFKAYSRNMIPKEHPVNEMTIILSKNYGLFKTLNFCFFPDIIMTDYFFNEQLEEFELVGLSEPVSGIQNLTWFEVFDFQPGDELHILYSDFTWGPDCGNYSSTRKNAVQYLERSDYPDSIVYLVLHEGIEINDNNNEKSFRYLYDTLRSVIKPRTDFDKLPGEPFIDSYQAYANSMIYNDFLMKSEPPSDFRISGDDGTCWHMPISDGCSPINNYYKGLGGPYYDCSSAFMCLVEMHNNLVYYKKGDKTWGTPLVISSLNDISKNPDIEIYPNPAKDKITLTINPALLPVSFELIDLSGKKILQSAIHSEITPIPLDKSPAGIYVYRIVDIIGMVSYGKLMRE